MRACRAGHAARLQGLAQPWLVGDHAAAKSHAAKLRHHELRGRPDRDNGGGRALWGQGAVEGDHRRLGPHLLDLRVRGGHQAYLDHASSVEALDSIEIFSHLHAALRSSSERHGSRFEDDRVCGWRVANRVGLLADELEKGSRARKAWEEGGNLCFVADIQRVGVFSRQGQHPLTYSLAR